jgi:hypothetical protein
VGGWETIPNYFPYMENFSTFIKIIIWLIIALFAIFNAFSLLFLRRSVYLRTRKKRPPDEYIAGGITPERVEFETMDGIRSYGIFYSSGGGKRPLVIILHGYAHRMGANHLIIENVLKQGWNVFSFDFRGCGESDYPRTTIGLKEPLDVIGAKYYLLKRNDVDFDRVAIWGGSMGATVALRTLPFFKEIRAVVADSPYYDMTTIFGERLKRKKIPLFLLPYIIFLLCLLVRGNMWKASSANVLRDVDSIPILFIHGDRDIDVSVKDSEKLYELYKGPKEFLKLDGYGHYDHDIIPGYIQTGIDFIKKNFEASK